jgi:hypothetical protein
MKKVIGFIMQKAKFLAAVTLAAIVGGASAAVVMAAIPDNSGVVHGCYRNNNGTLRVVDNASASCGGNETSVNWPSTSAPSSGAQTAYAAFNTDRTLNTSYSTHINSYKFVPSDPSDPDSAGIYCFNVSFNPKFGLAMVDGDRFGAHTYTSLTPMGSTFLNDNCGLGYNAASDNIFPGSGPQSGGQFLPRYQFAFLN